MTVDYVKLAQEIGALVQTKNAAYGDAHTKSGDVLRILYPDGVKPEAYTDMLTIVRILDKLFRICTDKDALGEDPYKDIVGYSLLATARRGNNVAVEANEPLCLKCEIQPIPIGNVALCLECAMKISELKWPDHTRVWNALDARWAAGEGRHDLP